MPTKAELKKKARDLGFISNLESLGFVLPKNGFWFYRDRGEFIDVIDFWLKSSMNWVEVPIHCLVRNEITHCDMQQFPKGFTNGLSCSTGMFAGRNGFDYSGDPWKISSEANISDAFEKLFKLIRDDVDPWLNGLDTKDKVNEANA